MKQKISFQIVMHVSFHFIVQQWKYSFFILTYYVCPCNVLAVYQKLRSFKVVIWSLFLTLYSAEKTALTCTPSIRSCCDRKPSLRASARISLANGHASWAEQTNPAASRSPLWSNRISRRFFLTCSSTCRCWVRAKVRTWWKMRALLTVSG